MHGDELALSQSHILDQKTHHALSLAVRCPGVLPQSRKITRESQHTRTHLFINEKAICLSGPLVFLLTSGQFPKLAIPFALERIGNEAVIRVHLHVSPASQPCLIAGTFHVLATKPVGIFDARLDLLSHRQGHLQGKGRHKLEQERSYRFVDALAGYSSIMFRGT
jgi:hypothetical protein